MTFFPPGARLLITLCAIFVLIGIMAGCATPAAQSATFDQWVKAHETVLIVTRHDEAIVAALGGAGGGYDPVHNIAAVDLDKLHEYTTDPAQIEFRVRHEEFHGFELRYGIWRLMPGPTFAMKQEQGAQCGAQVLTGTVPVQLGGETDALGYWTCSSSYLLRVRHQMVLAGVQP